VTDQPATGCDVLIVGAGPTGLLLANLLGTMGVSTLIVERNPGTVQEPRAVSIDDESFRALQAAGVDAEVMSITSRGYGSVYFGPDGKPFAEVKPSQLEYGFEKRNAFQQPDLERVLRSALARHPSVVALFATEVLGLSQSDGAVLATLRASDGGERTIAARYAVACDGARSRIRQALDIALDGSTFNEPWLIVDLPSTRNRSFHTEVFCNPARSCITLPGPGGIRRYEFKLNPGETAEQAETEAFARALLASVGPDADEPLRRVKVYTFHARSARHWRRGRVFLAGDAAHLTPPFAGQGMNSGLRDAHNLAWKLDEALRSDSPAALLDSYEVERKPHAWQMITLALRMGQIMMPANRFVGAMTRTGFRILGLYPPAKAYVAQMKYKPKPRFDEGLLWKQGDGAADSAIGRMLPQPVVEAIDDSRALLDTVLPDRPVALIFSERPEQALSPADRDRLTTAGAAVIGLTPEWIKPVAADFPIVRDQQRLFSAPTYARYLEHVLLLRRDRYVAAAAAVTSIGDLPQKVAALSPSGPRFSR